MKELGLKTMGKHDKKYTAKHIISSVVQHFIKFVINRYDDLASIAYRKKSRDIKTSYTERDDLAQGVEGRHLGKKNKF
jgi:hypothetical protein